MKNRKKKVFLSGKIIDILVIGFFIIFPFALENVLYITPVVSRFTNETWFSFMASYTGAIATFIVLKITMKENQEALEEEKERLRRNYEIEKEIEVVKDIQKVLLLDKYDFLNINTMMIDYSRLVKDIKDAQYEIREIQFDDKEETARDKYLMCLSATGTYLFLNLYLDKIPVINSEEDAKKYRDSIMEKISGISKTINSKREELMDLYREYVHEMKLKEYE